MEHITILHEQDVEFSMFNVGASTPLPRFKGLTTILIVINSNQTCR